jgi:hypothetical protein
MRPFLSASLALAALFAPSALRAQMSHDDMGPPKHEFGVDMAVVYSKPSCTGCDGTFQIGTPVDVRIGLNPAGSMMIEPRFTFALLTGGGSTLLSFDPGVNVLFRMGHGHGLHNMLGPYFTVGADVGIVSAKSTGNPSTSGAVIGVNGGIGSRMAFGSGAATRVELFVGYQLKNTKLGSPNTLNIGARLGLSLFHH